jgi:hypothetical protein
MKLSSHRSSIALAVAMLALFVALAGVGVAATGGNFILGQPNSANDTTALSSDVTSAASLIVTNTGGKPAARFNSDSGVAPFSVNNGTKVASLNSDELDGIDSSGFTKGGGTLYSAHRENVAPGSGTLLAIPSFMTITYECDTSVGALLTYTNLYVVVDVNGSLLYQHGDSAGGGWVAPLYQPLFIHLLASRPKPPTVIGAPKVVGDVRITGAWDADSRSCTFQSVAEVFA